MSRDGGRSRRYEPASRGWAGGDVPCIQPLSYFLAERSEPAR
jgi:hypothetical protein